MRFFREFACLVIVAFACGLGCGDPYSAADHGHQHGSAHGGVAVELGDHEYHLDLLLNSEEGSLTAWVMDGHVTDFVRIPLPSFDIDIIVPGGGTNRLTLTAQSSAATGESAGNTSQFLGSAPWLKGVTEFTGIIPNLEIRGRRFTNFTFQYKP